MALSTSVYAAGGKQQALHKGQLIFKNGQRVTIYVTASEKRKLDRLPKGTTAWHFSWTPDYKEGDVYMF